MRPLYEIQGYVLDNDSIECLEYQRSYEESMELSDWYLYNSPRKRLCELWGKSYLLKLNNTANLILQ